MTSSLNVNTFLLSMQMHDGLEKPNGSSIMMLPTYVQKLPTG